MFIIQFCLFIIIICTETFEQKFSLCAKALHLGACEAVDAEVDGAVEEGEVAHHHIGQPLPGSRHKSKSDNFQLRQNSNPGLSSGAPSKETSN